MYEHHGPPRGITQIIAVLVGWARKGTRATMRQHFVQRYFWKIVKILTVGWEVPNPLPALSISTRRTLLATAARNDVNVISVGNQLVRWD